MPCQEPLKRTRIRSVTTIVPSRRTSTSAWNCWISRERSGNAPAGVTAASASSSARQTVRTVTSERYARNATLGLADLEEFALMEAERACNEIRRELQDARIEVAYHGVVVAP